MVLIVVDDCEIFICGICGWLRMGQTTRRAWGEHFQVVTCPGVSKGHQNERDKKAWDVDVKGVSGVTEQHGCITGEAGMPLGCLSHLCYLEMSEKHETKWHKP